MTIRCDPEPSAATPASLAAARRRRARAASRGVELDVLAAEAPRQRQTVLDIERLARLDVRNPSSSTTSPTRLERARVLLRRGGDLPDRTVRSLHDAPIAPEALRWRHRGSWRRRRERCRSGRRPRWTGTPPAHLRHCGRPVRARRRSTAGEPLADEGVTRCERAARTPQVDPR